MARFPAISPVGFFNVGLTREDPPGLPDNLLAPLVQKSSHGLTISILGIRSALVDGEGMDHPATPGQQPSSFMVWVLMSILLHWVAASEQACAQAAS